jgi:hypothetical protein
MARRKLTEEEKKIREKEKMEQAIKDGLERELKELRRDRYKQSEPSYFFSIGDKVHLGNLENVTITEVLDDGMIYLITYSSTDNNYGHPITTHGHQRYVLWHTIRPLATSKESFIKNDDLHLNYDQRQLSDILSKKYHFGLNLDPEYQRGYVWEQEDKEKLIDSIFNNVDIGKFVFIHKGYAADYMYEVLDGKQRVSAIIDFYENRFPYKGKYFNDLSYLDRTHFENYRISMATVKRCDEQFVYRLFIALNTTGKPIDEEHINKIKLKIKE